MLQVDTQIGVPGGTGMVTVVNGVLAGVGPILDPVVVQSGGTLAPGDAGIGVLSVSNTLTLLGTNVMEVNKNGAALTSDLVQGLTGLTYGGTLSLAISGPTALANGDSIKLFDSASYNGGTFASISPATPGTALAWDTSSLNVNGTLKVVTGSANTPPTLTPGSVKNDANGFSFSFSGPSGQPYTLLSTTNVAKPLSQWETTNKTGFLAGPGAPIGFTNASPGAEPKRFYDVRSP